MTHTIYYYAYGDGFRYINLGNVIKNQSDYTIVYNMKNKKVTTISSAIAEACIAIDEIDEKTLSINLMNCLDQNLGYIQLSKDDLQYYLLDPDICKFKLQQYLAPIIIRCWTTQEVSELLNLLKSDPIDISNINFLEYILKQL